MSSQHSTSVTISDNNEEIENKNIYDVTKSALLTVITDCLNQLEIITSIIPAKKKQEWSKIDRFQTLEERYGRPRILSTILPEAQGLQDLTDTQKLQRDTCQIITMLRKISWEIQTKDTCAILCDLVYDFNRTVESEKQLIDEFKANRKTADDLLKTIENETNDFKRKLQELTEIINNLDNDVHDATLEQQLTLRFADHWEKTRSCQNKMQLQLQESDTRNEITDTFTAVARENRIHAEIEKFIAHDQKLMIESIEKYMEKDDNETEQLDNAIKDLQAKRIVIKKNLEDMQTVMEQRQQEMDDWIADKRKRERQAKILEMQTRACIKIQAWWRGVMVRHNFGLYKYVEDLIAKRNKAKNKKIKKKK